MKFKPRISDQAVTVLGGLALLALAISAWVPQPCSLLKQQVMGCPNPVKKVVPTSLEEQQLAGVPHKDVSSELAIFTSAAQDYKKETLVNFQYRGDLKGTVAFLQIKNPDGYHDLALISAPVLVGLDWSTTRTADYQLFQRENTFDDQTAFLAHLPSSKEIAADAVAARDNNLKQGTYTPLETLDNLEGINYILTSAPHTSVTDGWYNFSKQFDTTDALVDKDGNMSWAVHLPNQIRANQPFRLSTVHINYQKIKPD